MSVMSLKRIFLLSLILLSVSFASPFSIELSLSGGIQHLYTNDDLFNNDPPGIMDESSDNMFYAASLKPAISCFYHNTGIYLSADKPFGHSYFDRYFILSGGLKQRINISDKEAVDIHVGTTWHSVNAAIHDNYEFFVSTTFKSLPGFDIGLRYQYQLFKQASLYIMANYNYNIYEVYTIMCYNPQYYLQTFSINAGVMFSFL
jgi:hypothetical protein